MSGDSLRTPLARVTGLGAAKDGTHHWWLQRLTAIALVPLSVWLVASLVSLVGAERAVVVAWLGHPLAAVLMLLILGTGFYHLKLGMQVVIEDYIAKTGTKSALLILNSFACIALFVTVALSVLKLWIGAGA